MNATEYILTLCVSEREIWVLKLTDAYGKNLFNGTFSNHVGVVCDSTTTLIRRRSKSRELRQLWCKNRLND